MADLVGIGPGFQKVLGFLDGVGQVADGVAGIVDTGADMAESVARGRGAISEEQRADEAFDLDQYLSLEEFKRGDNRLKIIAFAAAAVAVIVLFK